LYPHDVAEVISIYIKQADFYTSSYSVKPKVAVDKHLSLMGLIPREGDKIGHHKRVGAKF
jgi:hypothetical protein